MTGLSAQARERCWLIAYEDADVQPEVFADEDAARRAFAVRSVTWNCTLFAQAELLADLEAENERLREASHKSERDNEALVAQRQRLNDELLRPRLTTTRAWLAGFSCAQEQGRLARAREASGG